MAASIYFVQNKSLNSISKTGGAVTPLVDLTTLGGGAASIAVDATKVYWVNTFEGTVLRVDKAGGAAETVASGQGKPSRVRLDGTSVYWSTLNDGRALITAHAELHV